MVQKIKISVLTACLNEEDVLPIFIERVINSTNKVTDKWELIVVDDGSKDNTWEIIETHSKKDSRIKGIKLSKNFGHQSALEAGLLQCTGELVLVLDSDLQDPPELLSKMIEKLEAENAEIVYGKRVSRCDKSKIKKILYKSYYNILDWLADCNIPKDAGDFRLLTKRAVNTVCSLPEQDKFLRGLFAWTGLKQTYIEYDRPARSIGTPSYSFNKLIQLARDGIIGFSLKPLRLATIMAGTLGIIALLLIFWVLYDYFFAIDLPKGWASISILILICSSTNLLVLGIIGEYLAQIVTNVKNRPKYIITDQINL